MLEQARQASTNYNWDLAIADASQLLKTAPTLGEALRIRGCAYSRKGDWDAALTDLEQALSVDPKDAFARACHGYVLENQGVLDEALADYSEAIGLSPSTADFYDQRGGIYFRLERYDRAIADYSRAIKLTPSISHLYDSRGLAYWQKNKSRQALADFAKALRLNSENTDALAHQTALRRQLLDEGRWYIAQPHWIVSVILVISCAPLLIALVLLFQCRGMLGRHVDRCFVRAANGSTIFYPCMVGMGYVVPDAARQAELRKFAKWLPWAGVAVMPLVFFICRLVIVRPVSPIAALFIVTILATASSFGVFWASVGVATRGLVKTTEKRRIAWRERLQVTFADQSKAFHRLVLLLMISLVVRGVVITFCSRTWPVRSVGLFNVLLFGFGTWIIYSAQRRRNSHLTGEAAVAHGIAVRGVTN